MNIAIIGSGYVGLVTGICLAHLGHQVICVDNDAEKVNQLKKGQMPIFEPGLEPLLKKVKKLKKISFSSSIKEATRKSKVIFIAVGTPSKKNGDADLTYVENVTREVARNMDSYKLIVEKSTVPADTGKRIERTVRLNLPRKYQPGSAQELEFDVASNPEFLKEGSALADFMNPDRIVLGVETQRAEDILREIYKPLKARIVVTNMHSAEMIKHASNSFLATKISFINAVAQICDRVGADVQKVADGMGLDARIGRSFLDAGIGFGGSCFPKDVDAFIRLSEKAGYDFRLLKEVRSVNEDQKVYFLRMIEDKLWIIKDKVVAALGLAFKPNTDDIRNAPALDIVTALRNEGAKVRVYDPQAITKAKKVISGVQFCDNAYAAAKGSDCLLILTEWKEFAQLDWKRMHQLMRQAVIFDGRNLLDPAGMRTLGFEIFGIGRGKVGGG